MTYKILTAAAKMPASCVGRYGRLAVVELEPGFTGYPKMISERARGVRRIIRTWERLHVGKTSRCAFQVALREAMELVDELNAA